MLNGSPYGLGPGRIELAEVLAQRNELRVGERLPVEHEHEALAPSRFDRVAVAARERGGQVDAGDFGSERRVEMGDVHEDPFS